MEPWWDTTKLLWGQLTPSRSCPAEHKRAGQCLHPELSPGSEQHTGCWGSNKGSSNPPVSQMNSTTKARCCLSHSAEGSLCCLSLLPGTATHLFPLTRHLDHLLLQQWSSIIFSATQALFSLPTVFLKLNHFVNSKAQEQAKFSYLREAFSVFMVHTHTRTAQHRCWQLPVPEVEAPP